jgi:hypothetical protein
MMRDVSGNQTPQHFKPTKTVCCCSRLVALALDEDGFHVLVLQDFHVVQRYWSFMLEQPQIYRLLNGMDGVMIDRAKVGNVARGSFGAATDVL